MFFFFNDTATTEIYTLSLHDALPISTRARPSGSSASLAAARPRRRRWCRSEEHTSELQSPCNLVCRLLLEKKKKPASYRSVSSHERLTSAQRCTTPSCSSSERWSDHA